MDRSPKRSKPAPGFLPFEFLAEKPSLWVGFCALLSWTDLLLCFEGVLRDQVLEKGGLVHDPYFLGLSLAAALLLLLLAAAGRAPLGRGAFRFLLRPRTALIAGAVGALTSGAAVLLTAVAATVPPWAPLALGAVAGAVTCALTLIWAHLLGTLDLRAALLAVSLAAALQWLVLAIATLMGTAAHLVLAVSTPVLSSWAAAHNLEEQSNGAVPLGEPKQRPVAENPAGPEAGGQKPAVVGNPLLRLSLAMLVFSLVAQFVWCFFIKMLPGRLEVGYFPLVFASIACATAAGVALCAIVMERQHGYRLDLYYRLAFLFCLGGVAATGIAAADLEQLELFASYATVYTGYSLLGSTMWMLALGYAFSCREPIEHVVASVFGCQFLGLFLGFVPVELLKTVPELCSNPAFGSTVVFAASVLLAGAYVALFPERDLLRLSPKLFGMSPATVEDRCERLAREHGLTPRETQVLSLLARGRDAGYICEELGISRNTVNVHRKAVFAKLEVHSQQELLSAVEEARG